MTHRSEAELQQIFQPILASAERQASIADRFVDKNAYRIYLATLWANLVMDPDAVGIEEGDLESAHRVINLAAAGILGDEDPLDAAFRFLNSPEGERAMAEARVGKTHRELLLYFCSMILDPEGHRRWMREVRLKRDGGRRPEP